MCCILYILGWFLKLVTLSFVVCVGLALGLVLLIAWLVTYLVGIALTLRDAHAQA